MDLTVKRYELINCSGIVTVNLTGVKKTVEDRGGGCIMARVKYMTPGR